MREIGGYGTKVDTRRPTMAEIPAAETGMIDTQQKYLVKRFGDLMRRLKKESKMSILSSNTLATK